MSPQTHLAPALPCHPLQLYLGPLRIPVPAGRRDKAEGGAPIPGYIDWLYLDEDLRITRGSKGSLFIHRKEQE